MYNFKEIKPEEFKFSPFDLIGNEWMLITAKKEDKVNTMTASWGGLGVIWNKNVAYIVIRPQRYTKEFVDAADEFSLSFFDEAYKDKLSYLGSVSGRDEDKIQKSELTIEYKDGIPFFKEANMALFCKKLYAQSLTPESFIDMKINEECYPKSDHHTLYIGEVTNIITRCVCPPLL